MIDMNVLKRNVIKTIPVWMLVIIMIGTVAGAVFWISNLVSTNVTVTDPPIEISGSFESVHYVGMERISSFTYLLNDAMMAVGYIVIDITQPTMSLTDVGGITVLVRPDVGGDITGAVYDIQPLSMGYRYVFSNTMLNAFDFGEMGMAMAGEIHVGITFESTGSFGVSMQITQNQP
ncbi:MAG: hypothetical protein ACW987_18880 [Candidatus Thorarchaeota archaeon]|jgi:hypothetical protein